MKNLRGRSSCPIGLVLLTRRVVPLHFLFFRDAHHIFNHLLGDIAFLPSKCLFVTLIINQLLSNRDKKAKLKKMNMVIGTFFNEVGGDC